MKKYRYLLLLPLALSGMVSCNNERKELKLTSSTKTIYDQYEKIKYDDFVVSGLVYNGDSLVNTVEITDFKLYNNETNELIENNSILEEDGENFEIKIVKDGYESYVFTIDVLKAKDYSQKLIVTAPTKNTYTKGDKVDLTGLNVQVETQYYTGKDFDEKHTIETLSEDDYTLEISGLESLEDAFDGYGIYTATISVPSYTNTELKTTITSSFYLYSVQENMSKTPVDYSYHTDSDWEDDERSVTIEISNPNSNLSSSDKGYLTPDEINSPKNLFDYGQNNAQNWQYSPSTGDIPFLVIPFVVPDYKNGSEVHENTKLATSELWNKINDAFFGDSTDIPFESLRSYYKKSSYGQLNIVGTITDFYVPAVESDTFNTYLSFTNPSMDRNAFIDEALTWAKETYDLDLTKFDSDHNGILDGVWFIAVNDMKDSDVTNFWGFSSSTEKVGTAEEPTINNYGWLCSDFLTNSVGEDASLDPHVIIHESGHMFGLSDYYSYSYTYDESGDRYSPLGKADMMDNNVGDHNPFSKLLMGWEKPYVVYGNSTISIKTSQIQDQIILIPYDSKNYSDEKYKNENGKVDINLFDEYLLLEFYSDKNLNSRGYKYLSEENEIFNIEGYGVKVYHVDNRLFKADKNYGDGTYKCSVIDPDEALSLLDVEGSNLIKAVSNTESGTRSENSRFDLPLGANYYDEIRLIAADGTFVSNNNYAKNSYLFGANGDIKTNARFSLGNYKAQFVDEKFNIGEDFSYTFTIKSFN